MDPAATRIEDGAATRNKGLRPNAVGFMGVLAESVSEITPSAAVALLVPLVAVSAGNGSWLSWVICTAILWCVAFCCSQILKHRSVTGGLIGLVDTTGFRTATLGVAGCVLAFALWANPGNIVGVALLFQNWFNAIGVGSSPWLVFGISVVAILLGSGLAAQDIALSAAALLAIELVTLSLIAILMLIVLIDHHHGSFFDTSQLTMRGVSFHGLLLGVVAAGFAAVSFECSATLGAETKDAHKALPRSLYASVLGTGLIFVIASYVMTLGFAGVRGGMAASTDPLGDLARMYGVNWMRYLILFGVALGYFGAVVAFVNWSCRVLYTLASDGLLPRFLAKVNRRTRTPTRAIWVLAVLALAYNAALGLSGQANLVVWGYVATAGACMYFMAYLIALAAFGFRGWRQPRRVVVAVVSVLGIAGLGLEVFKSVSPTPPYPLSLWTWVGVGTGAIALGGAIMLRRTGVRLPPTIGQGTTVDTIAEGVDAGGPDLGAGAAHGSTVEHLLISEQ